MLASADPDPRWHWRNTRSLGVSLHLFFWPWHIGAERDEDVYGGLLLVSIGPIALGLHYGIGNYSPEWERAKRYEEG